LEAMSSLGVPVLPAGAAMVAMIGQASQSVGWRLSLLALANLLGVLVLQTVRLLARGSKH
jgi:hypothetical protein